MVLQIGCYCRLREFQFSNDPDNPDLFLYRKEYCVGGMNTISVSFSDMGSRRINLWVFSNLIKCLFQRSMVFLCLQRSENFKAIQVYLNKVSSAWRVSVYFIIRAWNASWLLRVFL